MGPTTTTTITPTTRILNEILKEEMCFHHFQEEVVVVVSERVLEDLGSSSNSSNIADSLQVDDLPWKPVGLLVEAIAHHFGGAESRKDHSLFKALLSFSSFAFFSQMDLSYLLNLYFVVLFLSLTLQYQYPS